MNKPVWIYILLLVLLVPANVEAQRWKLKRYEAGIGLGTVTSFMDIGSPDFGITSFRPYDTRLNVSSHAGFLLFEELTVKLDLNYLMIGAMDPVTRERSLRFTSHALEHGVRFDYTFLGGGRAFGSTALFNRRGMVNSYGTSYLYVFGGAAGILSKATVRNSSGEEVDPNVNQSYNNNLQYGLVIPAGLGYRKSIDAYFDVVFEVGGRFSFTDLIDGYKHPTASHYNDRYIITSVKAIYKIRNDRKGRPIFSKYGRR
jgi:hypothetical protein